MQCVEKPLLPGLVFLDHHLLDRRVPDNLKQILLVWLGRCLRLLDDPLGVYRAIDFDDDSLGTAPLSRMLRSTKIVLTLRASRDRDEFVHNREIHI
jgi:hypothetical protein